MKRKAHGIRRKIMDQDVRTPSVLVVEQEQNMIQELLSNGIIFVRDVLKSFGLTQVIQKLHRERQRKTSWSANSRINADNQNKSIRKISTVPPGLISLILYSFTYVAISKILSKCKLYFLLDPNVLLILNITCFSLTQIPYGYIQCCVKIN